jgi:uncharacterized membrane protein
MFGIGIVELFILAILVLGMVVLLGGTIAGIVLYVRRTRP